MTAIERSVRLPVSAEEAFSYLTDSASVATIFGAQRASVEPREGGAFELYFDSDSGTDSTEGCKIITFEHDKTLVAEFHGPREHRPFGFMSNTTVSFYVEADGQESQLSIRHDGFGDGDEWAEAKEYFEQAWDDKVHNLQVLAAFTEQNRAATTDELTQSAGSTARPRFDLSSVRLTSIRNLQIPRPIANIEDQL